MIQTFDLQDLRKRSRLLYLRLAMDGATILLMFYPMLIFTYEKKMFANFFEHCISQKKIDFTFDTY